MFWILFSLPLYNIPPHPPTLSLSLSLSLFLFLSLFLSLFFSVSLSFSLTLTEKSLIKLFLEQFNDLLPQILLAAAFISFVSGPHVVERRLCAHVIVDNSLAHGLV